MARSLYLALGDSVTAGYGATHPTFAFVGHVSDFVRKESLAERTIVVAKNGWTSKDLWQTCLVIPPPIWQQTNVLTLMVGGNDLRRLLRNQFLTGAPITPEDVMRRHREFGFHLQRLCEYVSRQEIPHVLVATVYNPVPNSPFAVTAMGGLNEITRQIAEHYHFQVVDVDKKFLTREAYYIEGYRTGRMEDLGSPMRRPIHPNNAGHREIADLIIAQLATRTSSKKPTVTGARRKTSRRANPV